jgi:5-methylcytosine-specific restriction endonuclease McrA
LIRKGKTGRIRRTGADISELRWQAYLRAEKKCEVCGVHVSFDGSHRMEMAHVEGRGRGGSDVLENVRCLCSECHQAEHNPKAVPGKGLFG